MSKAVSSERFYLFSYFIGVILAGALVLGCPGAGRGGPPFAT